MKITNITAQQKNRNRVNIFVDGSYRLSLDIYQVSQLGVAVGREYSQAELQNLEAESQFGKIYNRALEYCLMRPHSAREVRDYLWRKTRSTKRLIKPKLNQPDTDSNQAKLVEVPGIPESMAERVFERLQLKGYIDDYKFCQYWLENRNLTKGISRRKLTSELLAKGVDSTIIEEQLAATNRSDEDELVKIVTKKYHKYDQQKLVAYLARQGFGFNEIKQAIKQFEEATDS